MKLRCDAHDVSTTMVAKRDDIERLATEDAPDVAALSGWRRRVFGAAAIELREGRLALTGDGRGVLEIERG